MRVRGSLVKYNYGECRISTGQTERIGSNKNRFLAKNRRPGQSAARLDQTGRLQTAADASQTDGLEPTAADPSQTGRLQTAARPDQTRGAHEGG